MAQTVSISGYPSSYRAVYYLDGLRGPEGFNAPQPVSLVDASEAFTGPFATTAYPGLIGDGPHWVNAKIFDILTNVSTGAPLCTTATVNFVVRIEGQSSIALTQTTRGVGETDITPPITADVGGTVIDGMDQSYGLLTSWPAFGNVCASTTIANPPLSLRNYSNSYCWPNGTHLIQASLTGPGNDPYVASKALSSVAGNVINFATQHIFQNGRPVVFKSVSGLSPIVAGSQWMWATSATNSANTATLTWSGSTGTITTSSASGASGSTPIFIQNIPYTNQSNGSSGCDGPYTGTASGTTITFTASASCPAGTVTAGTQSNPVTITLSGTALPANGDVIVLAGFTGSCGSGVGWTCLNGSKTVTLVSGSTYSVSNISTVGQGAMAGTPTYDPPGVTGCSYNTCNLEVDINPYFAIVDPTTISSAGATTALSVSATPGGAAVALTCSTCSATIQTRMNSPWYTCAPETGGANGDLALFDYTNCGGMSVVSKLVTFSNGTFPMGIDLPYSEYHGYVGKSGDTLCPAGATWLTTPGVINTDLTHTASSGGCTDYSYTIVSNPGVTGAVSISSSGAITYNATSSWTCDSTVVGCPPAQGGWTTVQIRCVTCGTFPPVTSTTSNTINDGSTSYTFTVASCGNFVTGNPINVTRTGYPLNSMAGYVSSCSGTSLVFAYLFEGGTPAGPYSAWTITLGVPYATAVIQNCGASPCTFPHWSYKNGILSSFTPGESFYPITVQQARPQVQKPWAATAFHHANVNSVWSALAANADMVGLLDPSATTCPDPTTQVFLSPFVAWLNANQFAFAFDFYSIYTDDYNYPTTLQAILHNTGYNRQACLQTLVSYLQAAGLGLYAANNDDEITNAIGAQLNPNPTIGVCGAQGVRWCEEAVSAGVATFTVYNLGNINVWSQSAGTGSSFSITGITSTAACNGLYLPYSVTTTSGVTTLVAAAPSGCTPGAPITSTTDSAAQISAPFSDWSGPSPAWQNAGYLPWDLSAGPCAFGQSTPCQRFGASTTTYVTLSGSTATLHCPAGVCGSLGIGGYLTAGQIIRIWNTATANLNIIATITNVPDDNDVEFVYGGGTGEAAPTCTGAGGQCNYITDPYAYFTVDPMLGINPLSQFWSIITGMSNPPTVFYTVLGSFFGGPNSVVTDYEGTPTTSNAAWIYVAGPPLNIYGYDGSVWSWGQYSSNGGKIATRPYQLPARGALIASGGPVGNDATTQICLSFTYNPACDRPTTAMSLRAETMLEQMMTFKVNGVSGERLYGEYDEPEVGYQKNCCGWYNRSNWQTTAMSPMVGSKRWHAYAEGNALLKMREDTELQPETNKPNLGPYFQTDAHLSSTYGNETTVLSSAEMPQGARILPLNAISGGSTLLYTSDGYTTQVSTVAGNPSSITKEFSPSPGFTSVYVSQPPGYTALDNMTFAPPSPLPFGASKFLIRVGYYVDDMRDAAATDCTSTCTIPVDHHNLDAYFQVIYADSNSLPRSQGSGTKIPSQGLY